MEQATRSNGFWRAAMPIVRTWNPSGARPNKQIQKCRLHRLCQSKCTGSR